MPRKVEVVPYDPAWPAQAEAEIARLSAALAGLLVVVHHFGSTAVPGLCAKPIIDLLGEVTELDQVEAHNAAMIALGYTPLGEYGLPGRRFFPRIIDPEISARSHHVHLYQAGHPEIRRHLVVRDYLRAHSAEAAAYGELKAQLAAQFPWDIDRYLQGKDAFVKALEQRALAWAA